MSTFYKTVVPAGAMIELVKEKNENI